MPAQDVREFPKYSPYQPTPVERGFDRVLNVIAPRRALQNAYYRERRHAFGYEGARITRARMNATRAGTITSNTPMNSSDRVQLIWEARDLAMNDPFIHGLLDKFAHYVVGPRFRIECMTGDPGMDRTLQEYLCECMEHCDYTEKVKFTDYARLVVMSVLRDGDFGIAYHDVPDLIASQIYGSPQSWIRCQSWEADCIGGYHYWIEPGYVSGVQYDENSGRVTGYRLYPRNNFGYYNADFAVVPPEQFTFLAYRSRTDAYRGVSALSAAIPTARDIKEILENEKFGVKWANSWAGFITVAPGSADGADPSSIYQAQVPGTLPTIGVGGNPNTVTRIYEDFHPGQIGYLSPNEKIEAAKTDRPSTSFNGFLALLYRQVCVSIGMPFGFAFDTTALGGVAARLESMQAKRTFEWWQHHMDENFYQPLFRRWIGHGIITGRLRFPTLTKLPTVLVSFPAHPTVDVGRESKADVSEYEAGIVSFSRLIIERGGNPREEIERMADDAKAKIDAAKARGIPVELILPKPQPIGAKGGSSGGGGGGGDAGEGISSGV